METPQLARRRQVPPAPSRTDSALHIPDGQPVPETSHTTERIVSGYGKIEFGVAYAPELVRRHHGGMIVRHQCQAPRISRSGSGLSG
jgi:hypothetical protein